MVSGMKTEEAKHSFLKKIYRYLGDLFAQRLINTQITPNQVTIVFFPAFILSAYFFFRSDYISIVIGAILLQVAIIADHIDGSLARMKGLVSDYGSWLDELSGTYGFASVYIGITLGTYKQVGEPYILVLGFLALIFSLIKKGTQSFYLTKFKFAKKFGQQMYKKIDFIKIVKPSAPLFVTLFSLGAVFNKLNYALIFWGVYYPIYTIAQNALFTLKARKEIFGKKKQKKP